MITGRKRNITQVSRRFVVLQIIANEFSDISFSRLLKESIRFSAISVGSAAWTDQVDIGRLTEVKHEVDVEACGEALLGISPFRNKYSVGVVFVQPASIVSP